MLSKLERSHMNFSTKVIKYLLNLQNPAQLTNNIETLNPYITDEVQYVVTSFYKKFYSDENERLFIFGINPGRFGGGLTGISFTDPVVLRELCGIENDLSNRKELSSQFVYNVVEKFGGTKKFFSKIFLTAIYPFAIIKNGKNYNYYDEKLLSKKLRPEIIKNINSQIGFGARKNLVILLGKKNAEFFTEINKEHKFFQRISVLEHPRYIMQYQLKKIDDFVKKYIDAINI
jgi:hypothetical protein